MTRGLSFRLTASSLSTSSSRRFVSTGCRWHACTISYTSSRLRFPADLVSRFRAARSPEAAEHGVPGPPGVACTKGWHGRLYTIRVGIKEMEGSLPMNTRIIWMWSLGHKCCTASGSNGSHSDYWLVYAYTDLCGGGDNGSGAT